MWSKDLQRDGIVGKEEQRVREIERGIISERDGEIEKEEG